MPTLGGPVTLNIAATPATEAATARSRSAWSAARRSTGGAAHRQSADFDTEEARERFRRAWAGTSVDPRAH